MIGLDFIKQVQSLRLPTTDYLVFGGGCLAALNLRMAEDIDLFITEKLYNRLLKQGWQETRVGKRKPYLVTNKNGVEIQAFSVWEGEGWQPQIANYFNYPEIIKGIPFMPLDQLYQWKAATRRPKDLVDMALIEVYWQQRRLPMA